MNRAAMVPTISIRQYESGKPRGHAAPVIKNNELPSLVESDPRKTAMDMAE